LIAKKFVAQSQRLSKKSTEKNRKRNINLLIKSQKLEKNNIFILYCFYKPDANSLFCKVRKINMVEMTIGVKKNTLRTANEFFNDIKVFTPGKANYEFQLYPRVEKFFLDMNKLGKKEFAFYLTQQCYTCNINSNDEEDKIRNLDVFYCLTALIICHYSKIDTLRYFFPEEFTTKVERPTYSSDSWRIFYWFQVLSYWFSQLFDKKKYQANTSTSYFSSIVDSLQFVRNAMKDSNYLQLINSGPESLFSSHLFTLTSCVLRIATLTLNRIANSSIPGDCSPRFNMFSIPKEESNLPKENAASKSSSVNVKK
jgi:hypothetical protein